MKISITKKVSIAALGAIVLGFTACENSPYPGFEMTESGLYYQFINHDEKAQKPKETDIVKVVMQYSTTVKGKDSLLFDSKDPKFNQMGTNYMEFPVSKSSFKGSFEEALTMMAVGDSAVFKVKADSVYLRTFQLEKLPAYIDSTSVLTFNVRLLKITSKEEAIAARKKKIEEMQKDEMAKLSQYITTNKITTQPTESGLYYIELKKGKGPTLKMGDVVKVNYTGRFIDGSVFDTSDEKVAKESQMYDERMTYGPVDFTVGGLVPGFNEALLKMNPGTKAKLIIPSSIGYGDGQGRMAPFVTLVFDVELGELTKKAPAEGAVPNLGTK